jgi:hypothetical protein
MVEMFRYAEPVVEGIVIVVLSATTQVAMEVQAPVTVVCP